MTAMIYFWKKKSLLRLGKWAINKNYLSPNKGLLHLNLTLHSIPHSVGKKINQIRFNIL